MVVQARDIAEFPAAYGKTSVALKRNFFQRFQAVGDETRADHIKLAGLLLSQVA